jgi:hypothetical protein
MATPEQIAERTEFANRIALATSRAAADIRNVAVAEAEKKSLASGIQVGISAADEFMKSLAVVTGNILKQARDTLVAQPWFDDIGIHAQPKHVAQCVKFILEHGHPTYQKIMKDSIAHEYKKAIFTSGRGVEEGSRLYPIAIIQSGASFIFRDCDAFKAFCLWQLYVPDYADPNDYRKFYVTSLGFSELLMGIPIAHTSKELPIDAMSLEDVARRGGNLGGAVAGALQQVAAGGNPNAGGLADVMDAVQ